MAGEVYEIRLTETEERFNCKAEQTVLNAMTSLGRKGIPSGCHGGGCGICKIYVTKGKYNFINMSRAHISEQEELDGFCLACRIYPETDIELKVWGKMRKNVIGPYVGFFTAASLK